MYLDDKTIQQRLRQAIASLRINRPILRAEIVGEGVRLYLYGGEVREWQPQPSRAQPASATLPAQKHRPRKKGAP